MIITNGTVEFERSIRPADYETKRVRVSLSFTVAEGADAEAATEEAVALAQRQVMKALNRSENEKAEAPVTMPRKPPTVAAEPARAPAAEEPPLKPTITDKTMSEAVARARETGVGVDAIRALIGTFTEEPGARMSTIVQEKRAAFLSALKEPDLVSIL